MSGWIGVDLDGTLAHYTDWMGADHVGEPIPAMMKRVKKWIEQGAEVRIFTARVAVGVGNRAAEDAAEITKVIQDWCEKHELPRLAVTNVKDFHMLELWDDRAVSVEQNTGRILGGAR